MSLQSLYHFVFAYVTLYPHTSDQLLCRTHVSTTALQSSEDVEIRRPMTRSLIERSWTLDRQKYHQHAVLQTYGASMLGLPIKEDHPQKIELHKTKEHPTVDKNDDYDCLEVWSCLCELICITPTWSLLNPSQNRHNSVTQSTYKESFWSSVSSLLRPKQWCLSHTPTP